MAVRRGPLIAAVAVVVLTALLAVVTNWATEVVAVPPWLADPTVIVLVGLVLVLLLAVAGFVAGRPSEPAPASVATPTFTAVAPSLRPPPPGPVFGRDHELAALTAPRREPVLDVVCAGGGTGKTTLARELARRHGAKAFWIDWRNDPEVLATSMVEVGTTLGLSPGKVAHAQRTGASLADLVWSHLESTRGWLVVVDNVDDVDALQSGAARISTYRGWLRPTAAGQLVVTTRLQDPELWGPHARLHRIGRLPTSEAAAVLRNLAPHGGDAAEELADRLGGHPLALRAAGTAVGAATSAWPTFAAYLAALQEQRISVLPDAPRDTGPETARRLVGHTWEVSLDQLVAKPGTRLARPLLRALSLLARAPVPRGLITPALLPGSPSETAVNDALNGLYRYGLLEPTAPGTVLLHPLVRETSAAFLAQEADVDEWRERVEDRVVAFVHVAAARERDGWDDAALLVPHVLGSSVLDAASTGDGSPDDRFASATAAAKELANQLETAGRIQFSAEIWQRDFGAEAKRLGPNHQDTIVSRGHVGWLRFMTGEQEAGEQEMRRAVLLAAPIGGDLLLNLRHNLATVLLQTGAAVEAVEHLTKVYEACVTEGGPDSAASLLVQHHLALAVHMAGDHDRGLRLLRDSLAAKVRVLGTDDLETARIRGDLGNALGELDEHEEAVVLHEESMRIRAEKLGDTHPWTLDSRDSLASGLAALGQTSRALDLARRTLADHERFQGPEHPATLRSRDLVARCEEARRSTSPLGGLRALLRR